MTLEQHHLCHDPLLLFACPASQFVKVSKPCCLFVLRALGCLLGGEVGMKLGRRTTLESLIEQGRF